MAVFCSSFTSWFSGMLLMYFLNDFEMVPVAPIITGITLVFTFYTRLLLLLLLLIRPSIILMAARLRLAKRPDRPWGLTTLLFILHYGYFPGVKRPGREVDHSPPFSAEIKNEWGSTFAPLVCLHSVYRESCTYYYYYYYYNYIVLMYTWCGRKVMRLATLCTNRQRCCLPLQLAVRLTPVVDSVQD